MKHNLKITSIILIMFLLTQFIGLYVVNHYSTIRVIDGKIQNVSAPNLPFGMNPPEIERESDYYSLFTGLIIAFVMAIVLLFLLTKFEWKFIIKLWFFVVVIIALGISFASFFPQHRLTSLIAVLVAVPLAFIKIYRQNFLVHNITELFVYPGIAAVFVPILNIWTIIVLLILISFYDMWAVWHSGIMQKMAKYQIDTLNIFSGFFVPYANKKVKEKIKLLKQKYKSRKISKKELKSKKFKINIAILGGGDVIFPIITSGVMLKTFGMTSAILVILGALFGLAGLFLFSEKKKFYPAMPFITAGIFLGIILNWLIF